MAPSFHLSRKHSNESSPTRSPTKYSLFPKTKSTPRPTISSPYHTPSPSYKPTDYPPPPPRKPISHAYHTITAPRITPPRPLAERPCYYETSKKYNHGDVSPLSSSRFESPRRYTNGDVSPLSRSHFESPTPSRAYRNATGKDWYGGEPLEVGSHRSNHRSSGRDRLAEDVARRERERGGRSRGASGVDERRLGIKRGDWNRANFLGDRDVGGWELY